jgi:hypothetical protein
MCYNYKFSEREFLKIPPPPPVFMVISFQIPYMCIGAPRALICPRTGIREINKLK